MDSEPMTPIVTPNTPPPIVEPRPLTRKVSRWLARHWAANGLTGADALELIVPFALAPPNLHGESQPDDRE